MAGVNLFNQQNAKIKATASAKNIRQKTLPLPEIQSSVARKIEVGEDLWIDESGKPPSYAAKPAEEWEALVLPPRCNITDLEGDCVTHLQAKRKGVGGLHPAAVEQVQQHLREIDPRIQRHMQGRPEAGVDFDEPELVGVGVPAVFEHDHALPAQVGDLGAGVFHHGLVPPTVAQRAVAAGVRDLVQAAVHELLDDLALVHQKIRAGALAGDEALHQHARVALA